mmetsp:Transcript_10685/g.32183  ORF Transcript_10685/g.32183 Transcript_10685/m.32183 type:complete len:244 (+) Transcript_10685:613-1344(+)
MDASPSVAVARLCVSPRVKTTDPCVVGSGAMSTSIGRTVTRSRPSARRPSVRTIRAISFEESFLRTRDASARVKPRSRANASTAAQSAPYSTRHARMSFVRSVVVWSATRAPNVSATAVSKSSGYGRSGTPDAPRSSRSASAHSAIAVAVATASARAASSAASASASGTNAPSASTMSTDPSAAAPTTMPKSADATSAGGGSTTNVFWPSASSRTTQRAAPTASSVGTELMRNAAAQAWTAKT